MSPKIDATRDDLMNTGFAPSEALRCGNSRNALRSERLRTPSKAHMFMLMLRVRMVGYYWAMN